MHRNTVIIIVIMDMLDIMRTSLNEDYLNEKREKNTKKNKELSRNIRNF